MSTVPSAVPPPQRQRIPIGCTFMTLSIPDSADRIHYKLIAHCAFKREMNSELVTDPVLVPNFSIATLIMIKVVDAKVTFWDQASQRVAQTTSSRSPHRKVVIYTCTASRIKLQMACTTCWYTTAIDFSTFYKTICLLLSLSFLSSVYALRLSAGPN